MIQYPAVWTQPLCEDFISDGPKLREFVKRFWKTPEQPDGIELDAWQAWLIDRVLERYPPGHPNAGELRYRQVLISMGRQNGKSVLGAVFGLYGLMMHVAGPEVISLASNADQANIIYNRVRFVIDNNRALAKRFKATGTRGISRLDKAGTYKVKPAKADALQGIPVSLCLYDEVHITAPEMWSAMVLGTSARDNGLVLGITTAGDDNSVLLKRLYKTGQEAAQGDPDLERFGFFCWEAPAGAAVDDPDALRAANPSLAAGRLNLERLRGQVRTLPEVDARRYHLNQFVASSGSWIPLGMWLGTAGEVEVQRPIAFAIDRTPNWEHAAITASYKKDGKVYTTLIRSINRPSIDLLVDYCVELWQHNPQTFCMDGYPLKPLADELKRRGLPVRVFNQQDIINACSTSFALIAQNKVVHSNDELVNLQMPRAVRKNINEAWRISRQDSSVEIDAVMATVLGIYAAETTKEMGIQVF